MHIVGLNPFQSYTFNSLCVFPAALIIVELVRPFPIRSPLNDEKISGDTIGLEPMFWFKHEGVSFS